MTDRRLETGTAEAGAEEGQSCLRWCLEISRSKLLFPAAARYASDDVIQSEDGGAILIAHISPDGVPDPNQVGGLTVGLLHSFCQAACICRICAATSTTECCLSAETRDSCTSFIKDQLQGVTGKKQSFSHCLFHTLIPPERDTPCTCSQWWRMCAGGQSEQKKYSGMDGPGVTFKVEEVQHHPLQMQGEQHPQPSCDDRGEGEEHRFLALVSLPRGTADCCWGPVTRVLKTTSLKC
ncbi:hypothetical protein SKAU_G00156300 [Synaphobranchus kaupii]|uniref:Uncharacterized protein n=1 Tax=Synaphobranchus kaupii TaxID=118154 RepID=A0A9Q1FI65_SYNKA|nr:hypothetical protein SKAU_G00156300 [Synaphobranchus kaupii]